MEGLSIRELELIRDAISFTGRLRNGTSFSQELADLHEKVTNEHKKLINKQALEGQRSEE